MLLWAIPHIRNVQSQSWWRKALNRSCEFEAELVHNLHVSILEEDFVNHDIWFLNAQARFYLEHCNSQISLNYERHQELIVELFTLVPHTFRSKLQWNGPKVAHVTNTPASAKKGLTLYQLLVNAISDGINKYLNQVLIPGQYVDEERLQRDFIPNHHALDAKYAIAQEVAMYCETEILKLSSLQSMEIRKDEKRRYIEGKQLTNGW